MNKNHRHRHQQGFTLIELLIYMALIAIFISGAIFFAWDIILGRVKSSVQQELNQNLRFAVKRISFEIRNASSVSVVTPSSLSLAQSDSSRNPTVIDVSGGRVRMGWGISGPCPATAPCPVTTSDISITNLTFTNMTSGSSTNIRFSLTGQSTGSRSEYQATQSISGSSEVRRD